MNKKQGFTLVELLVVISIIALLLAVLMPALSKARDQARSVICKSHLKTWGYAYQLYAQANNNSLMTGWYDNTSKGCSGVWFLALKSYYGDSKIRFCPVAMKSDDEGASKGKARAWRGSSALIPVAGIEKIKGSYGDNWFMNNPPKSSNGMINGFKETLLWRRVDAGRGSEVPIFGDCTYWTVRPDIRDFPPKEDGDWNATTDQLQRFCVNRHNGYVNFVWLDCSVRNAGLKELWKLKWHRDWKARKPATWPDWMRSFKEYNY